jgi:hypothetical protein
MDQNKPSLFIRQICGRLFSSKWRLIVLNNLNSGNLTLTVYHDGAHFNEVSNFNFM